MPTKLPIVHYGAVDAPPIDWRAEELIDNSPDNDVELKKTPADVTALLGFDPKDL